MSIPLTVTKNIELQAFLSSFEDNLEYNQLNSNQVYNSKGEIVNSSTLSNVLDVFASFGTLAYNAKSKKEHIARLVTEAYAEDALMTLKALFYIRDIREGQGVRDAFRIAIKTIAKIDYESVNAMIPLFAYYGRYDDLLALFDTPCEATMTKFLQDTLERDLFLSTVLDEMIENHHIESSKAVGMLKSSLVLEQINKQDVDFHTLNVVEIANTIVSDNRNVEVSVDTVTISLLAKWLPSINASSHKTQFNARKLARAFGYNHKQYQKTLKAIRKQLNLIESKLSEKDYTFDYSHIPAKALNKYKDSFNRNDKERYDEYVESLATGKTKAKVATLYPHDIISQIPVSTGWLKFSLAQINETEKQLLNAQWKQMSENLANKMSNTSNFLPILDLSGSMRQPIANTDFSVLTVALGLTVLLAENNSGRYKNVLVPFANNAQFVEFNGDNIFDKVNDILAKSVVGFSTNICATFELLLSDAINNNIPADEMPKSLVYVSDMEFDGGWLYNSNGFDMSALEKKYAEAGYQLPQIIFWNVSDSSNGFLGTAHIPNLTLMAGFSSHNLNQIISGEVTTPYVAMVKILNTARYLPVEILFNDMD